MAIQPYLFFEGKTEEALGFYAKTLGAQTQTMMRYKDSPGGEPKFCAIDDPTCEACQ